MIRLGKLSSILSKTVDKSKDHLKYAGDQSKDKKSSVAIIFSPTVESKADEPQNHFDQFKRRLNNMLDSRILFL
jgi:hypothetical protein